ncbi:nuclear transport factor 2 family protein [Chloroflexota bacterium]
MSADDMLAIQQAVARYSYTFDSKDAEGWANIFTEDAIWEFFAAGETKPSERLESRDSIYKWAVQRHKEMPKETHGYHHQSGILFDELTADSARTRSTLILTEQDVKESSSARIILTGVYYDQWRKTPAGWRIAHRTLRV